MKKRLREIDIERATKRESENRNDCSILLHHDDLNIGLIVLSVVVVQQINCK